LAALIVVETGSELAAGNASAPPAVRQSLDDELLEMDAKVLAVGEEPAPIRNAAQSPSCTELVRTSSS
jgi:hypothetical protein